MFILLAVAAAAVTGIVMWNKKHPVEAREAVQGAEGVPTVKTEDAKGAVIAEAASADAAKNVEKDAKEDKK